jgi:hypothetical protein
MPSKEERNTGTVSLIVNPIFFFFVLANYLIFAWLLIILIMPTVQKQWHSLLSRMSLFKALSPFLFFIKVMKKVTST